MSWIKTLVTASAKCDPPNLCTSPEHSHVNKPHHPKNIIFMYFDGTTRYCLIYTHPNYEALLSISGFHLRI